MESTAGKKKFRFEAILKELRRVCPLRISAVEFAKRTGVSLRSIHSWKSGESLPLGSAVEKLYRELRRLDHKLPTPLELRKHALSRLPEFCPDRISIQVIARTLRVNVTTVRSWLGNKLTISTYNAIRLNEWFEELEGSLVAGGFVAKQAPEPVGAYPHARKAGNLLFLSGVGPRKKGSNIIPGVKLDPLGNFEGYDIEAQCRSCFDNMKTILEDVGSRWEDIVDVTVFLTDMKRDFPTFNRIYSEYFKDVQPTRTTVEVGALPTPIAIELKVIATIED